MKKFLTLCLLCLFTIAAFSFAGCTSNQKFTVTFDSNGGTYIESRVVEEGETIYKPSNPERQGYVFDAWYFDDQKWDFKKQKVTQDITLVAKWIIQPADGIIYMLNDDYSAYYVDDYLGTSTDITISSTYRGLPVNEIGSWAFSDTNIRNINLPDSIISIGDCAFQGCDYLTTIDLPHNLLEIVGGAFQNCDRLQSLLIPKSVIKLDSFLTARCRSLTSLAVEDGNLYYDSRDNCNAIIETKTNKLIDGCRNTVIPHGVLSIGNGAFEGKNLQTMINIPNSIVEIGSLAFADNPFLSIIIPSSVTEMGMSVFEDCLNLTIYCEVSSRPNGWSEMWNSSHNQVVWNYTKS